MSSRHLLLAVVSLICVGTISVHAQRPGRTHADAESITRVALEAVLRDTALWKDRPPPSVDVDASYRSITTGLGMSAAARVPNTVQPRVPFTPINRDAAFTCADAAREHTCRVKERITYVAVAWSSRQPSADTIAVWVTLRWAHLTPPRRPTMPGNEDASATREALIARSPNGAWQFARWGSTMMH